MIGFFFSNFAALRLTKRGKKNWYCLIWNRFLFLSISNPRTEVLCTVVTHRFCNMHLSKVWPFNEKISFRWNFSIFLRIQFAVNSKMYLTNINKRAECQWNRHYDWIAKYHTYRAFILRQRMSIEHIASPTVYRSRGSVAPFLPILSILAAHPRRSVSTIFIWSAVAGGQFMQSHRVCSLWLWCRRIVQIF